MMHGGLGMDHVSCLELEPLGSQVQLVYYDHRGNGRSGRPPIESLTMDQFADDAADLAASITSEKVIVFGHSYGGFIAQEFAIRHPDKVAGLILCDTTPGQLGEGELESSGPPPPQEFIDLLSNGPYTDVEFAEGMKRMLPSFFNRREAADVQRSLRDTVYCADANSRGFEVLKQWSSVDRLASITVPTLITVGSHDVFTSPPQTHRIARKMPDAEVVEFSESGHLPWMDEPARFFDVVGDWLHRNFA